MSPWSHFCPHSAAFPTLQGVCSRTAECSPTLPLCVLSVWCLSESAEGCSLYSECPRSIHTVWLSLYASHIDQRQPCIYLNLTAMGLQMCRMQLLFIQSKVKGHLIWSDMLAWCGLSVDKGDICWGKRSIWWLSRSADLLFQEAVDYFFIYLYNFLISHLSVTCSLWVIVFDWMNKKQQRPQLVECHHQNVKNPFVPLNLQLSVVLICMSSIIQCQVEYTTSCTLITFFI